MALGAKVGSTLGGAMMHVGTNYPKIGTAAMSGMGHVMAHSKTYSAIGGATLGAGAMSMRRSSHSGIDQKGY